MGKAQEAVVRSFLGCLNADDRDGAVAHFSDDAVYHMIPWRKPLVGRDAIGASFADARWVSSSILNMASTDSVVFAEGVDAVVREGTKVTIHWSIVVEVDQAGKIIAERDYWDQKEVDAQLA